MAREHQRTIAAATEALEIAGQLGLREVEASARCARSGSPAGSRAISAGATTCVAASRSPRRSARTSAPVLRRARGPRVQCGQPEDQLRAARARAGPCRDLRARGLREVARRERVGEWYWRGAWDLALEAADSCIAEAEAGTPNFMEGYCHAMRAGCAWRAAIASGALDRRRPRPSRSLDAAEEPQDAVYTSTGLRRPRSCSRRLRWTPARCSPDELPRAMAVEDYSPIRRRRRAVDLAFALEAIGREPS